MLLVTAPNSVDRDEDTDVDLMESMLVGTERTKTDHFVSDDGEKKNPTGI